MRFMAIIKANADSEAGKMPSQQLLSDMGDYNEELVKAGVMIEGAGLLPSSLGARVHFSPGGTIDVVDGPFAETKELVAGFWILEVASKEEAIEWIKRVPNTDDVASQIELRQVVTAEDFGEAFTPELREQEERTRAQAEENQR
ncbi:YciI family protein [Patulibacter defluvii]|uniref:YciI family protein n=1 Tax=Patulibacter defluvii TaxID=3095358 RepID=UPI002A75A3E5|nr:YciI family protein [Patulibacter sp. DM4]